MERREEKSMLRIVIILTILISLAIGFVAGKMSALPGKSEAHAILKKHGAYDHKKDMYFIYLPDNRFMSIEEFEAMTVVSGLYEHIDIVFPEDATGNIALRGK
jgi:hypothetical protein